MSVEVAEAVSNSVEPAPHLVTVLWHGGEPLATGLEQFRKLLIPFRELRKARRIRHSIQTNATLIDDVWCELFAEEEFRVGVSIDGYGAQNASRTYWSREPSYGKALRGIEVLKQRGIRFGVIAVLNDNNIDDPEGFYEFFSTLGCQQLNINVEEKEGLNRHAAVMQDSKVRQFWDRLFVEWQLRPDIRIREFDTVLGWMSATLGGESSSERRPTNLWPTVSTSGDVVVVSPELMAGSAAELRRFVVGNVLCSPLNSLVTQALDNEYVREAVRGFKRCRAACSYYAYCGGGEASNKYYETGRMDVTETAHCRHTRKFVVDAVLAGLSNNDLQSEEDL